MTVIGGVINRLELMNDSCTWSILTVIVEQERNSKKRKQKEGKERKKRKRWR